MWRLCGSFRKTVHHLLSGCKVSAGKEYLQRHKVLMVITIEWAKKYQDKKIRRIKRYYCIIWHVHRRETLK